MEQTLSSYRIFYAVANTGNISKAAKELYISQPAISKSIQKLEENVGVKLFDRSSRGVSLTPEGQLLYTHVKSAFETLTLGEDKLRRSIALGMGNLTIGVSATLCKYILLPYLRNFIKKFPHINISIACHSTNQTLKLLEEGKLHSTLLLLDRENMTRQYIDEYLHNSHIIAQDIIEVSNMDLLIEMSKISLGTGCVIKNFVQNELKTGALLEIPLEFPMDPRVVGFAYNKDVKVSSSLRHFIDFYESCGGSLNGV